MPNRIALRIARYLRKYFKDLAVVFTALIFVAAALLGLGHTFKTLVDLGITASSIHMVNDIIFIIFALICLFGISSFFRSYFINALAEKVIAKIRTDAFGSLLQLDIIHFETLKVGDILTRLTADSDLLSRLIVDFLSFFVRNTVMALGSIALMFYQAPKLSAIVLLIVPLAILPIIKLSKTVRELSRNNLNTQGLIAAGMEETFVNIRTLYSFNQQTNKTLAFNNQIQDYLTDARYRLKLRSIFFALSISIILCAITLIIWIGSRDILAGNMSSGSLVSFIYYSIAAGMSIGGIAELFSEAHKPLAAAERIFELIDKAAVVTNSSAYTLAALPITPVAIEFQGVSFCYPSRPEAKVLDDISLNIKTGSFIGIVGQSGSGKSTLMQLLLRLYHHDDGVIKVFGQDITTLEPMSLRKSIAYVPQDPSIFSGSIRSNIAFSRPEADNSEIFAIAEATGIMKFASALQAGLDTEIGERGVRLSGGQKQRIAIARALLYKPEILLLDEATGSIDTEGEEEILSTVRKLMQDKTVISIAHRISALEGADKIMVVDKSKIVATGTHQELLATSEIYQNLHSTDI